MGELNLRERGDLVRALGSSITRGESAIGNAPLLLKQLLETGSWHEFDAPGVGVVHYDRFETFLVTPPAAGLGTTVDLVRRIVGDDPVALDLLDQALQNPVGHPTILYNIQDKAPTGTSSAAALRRLRKDRPDLHTKVLAGELSPHGAMVEAGFRKSSAKPAGTWDDVAELLSQIVDRLNRLEERVSELEHREDYQ
jgi:hypothetical protein